MIPEVCRMTMHFFDEFTRRHRFQIKYQLLFDRNYKHEMSNNLIVEAPFYIGHVVFLLLKREKKYKTPSIWACVVLNRTEMLYIEMSEPKFLDVLQIYRQVSMQGTKPFIQEVEEKRREDEKN